ncbi:hypothetical protein [Pseudoxanthomonas wuyuanensis]|nr:hypothetical protein [Pseudoxanthomonas wuyuanensis]
MTMMPLPAAFVGEEAQAGSAAVAVADNDPAGPVQPCGKNNPPIENDE